jgi:hypothetical protein
VAGETIVFYPKYTTLCGKGAGGATYYSDPYDVTGYKTIDVETYAPAFNGSPTVTVKLEQSSDLITWSDADSDTLAEATLLTQSKTSPARYVRVSVLVNGATTGLTLWSKGVARES